MKKVLSLIATFILLLAVANASAESIDFSSMSEEQLRDLRQQIDLELASRYAATQDTTGCLADHDFGVFRIQVLGVALSQETLGANKGAPAIVVRYKLVNTGDETITFSGYVEVKLFQNGVQLNGGSLIEGTDGKQLTRELQPGAEIEVAHGFILEDEAASVDILIGNRKERSALPETVELTVNIK